MIVMKGVFAALVMTTSVIAQSTTLTGTRTSRTSIVSGTRTATTAPVGSATGTANACASIARIQEQTFRENSSATLADVPPFRPSLAYACLTSIPINKSAAVEFIDWYKPYLEFQSTLVLLKDPPDSYKQPGVDLMGGLDNISTSVSNGDFSNQYEFELAIQTLLHASHEGHLSVPTPAYSSFAFLGRYNFVSLSSDGTALPVIYVYADIVAAAIDGGSRNPSAVTQVNGQDVQNFLTEYAADFAPGMLEADADWNYVLYSAARFNGGAPSSPIRLSVDYPGTDYLNITFANGSSVSSFWLALAQIDMTGIRSGSDFYDLVIAPQEYSSSSFSRRQASTEHLPRRQAKRQDVDDTFSKLGAPYPTPVVVQRGLGDGGYVSGYFLNDNTTAVLSVTSFYMAGELAQTCQDAVTEFLDLCRSKGKTRLVIDLQGNGGGTVLLGIDLFKQLFPTVEPFVGSRLRAHATLDTIGNTLSRSGNPEELIGLPVFYQTSVDMDGNDFTSWADYYGPYYSGGDYFTSTERYNFSDADISILQSGDGIVVSGYANESGVAPQLFQPENIILLTDGYCASTCAVFAEQMTTQQNVRTVVVGGRPQTGPMQAVSGTRGALRYDALSIASIAAYALVLNLSLPLSAVPDISYPPFNFEDLSSVSFNFRDQVRDAEQGVPLQLIYQPASCRIWWTRNMLLDYSVLWQRAADAIWSGGDGEVGKGLCVEGSTGRGQEGTDGDEPNLGSGGRGGGSNNGTGSGGSNNGTGSGSGSDGSTNGDESGDKNAGAKVVLGRSVVMVVLISLVFAICL